LRPLEAGENRLITNDDRELLHMLIKIDDLTGKALDYAVAKAEGARISLDGQGFLHIRGMCHTGTLREFSPSDQHGHHPFGARIAQQLQAQGMTVARERNEGARWVASIGTQRMRGETPLEAIVRLYVSRLTHETEVDVPDNVNDRINGGDGSYIFRQPEKSAEWPTWPPSEH